MKWTAEQPSPGRVVRSSSPPAASNTVSRRLFAPPPSGAVLKQDSWRQVVAYLSARSEDGIACALSIVDGRNLTAGSALMRLHGPRPYLDAKLDHGERRRVEAMVAAAIEEAQACGARESSGGR